MPTRHCAKTWPPAVWDTCWQWPSPTSSPLASGPCRASGLAARLPQSCWQRLSAGTGAKGERWYDWALVEVSDAAVARDSGPNWLLIRRRISDGEYAFYRAHAPRPVPVTELVRVAGTRWKIEESFAGGKELAALDEHQVRSWTSWHRWTVLAMLAHAFLSVTDCHPAPGPGHGEIPAASTALA